jgi:hypothetical protein
MQATDETSPQPHPVLKRLMTPWEYRHPHASMAVHFAGGGFQLGVGLVLVSLGNKADSAAERRKCYQIAAWFLVPSVLNLAGGLMDMTVARTAAPGLARRRRTG